MPFWMPFFRFLVENGSQNAPGKLVRGDPGSILFATFSEGRFLDAFWSPLGSLLAPFWLPLGHFWLPFAHFWLPLAHFWLTFGVLWLTFGALGSLLAILALDFLAFGAP